MKRRRRKSSRIKMQLRRESKSKFTNSSEILARIENDFFNWKSFWIICVCFCFYDQNLGEKYRSCVRSRVFNLRDKKNPDLRENVIAGIISPKRLARMSAEVYPEVLFFFINAGGHQVIWDKLGENFTQFFCNLTQKKGDTFSSHKFNKNNKGGRGKGKAGGLRRNQGGRRRKEWEETFFSDQKTATRLAQQFCNQKLQDFL